MLTQEDGKNVDWAGMSLYECAEGNAQDIYFTLKIFEILEKELATNPTLYKMYEEVFVPLNTQFAQIELDGFDISKQKLEELEKRLGSNLGDLRQQILSSVGDDNFNPASPDQLSDFFYGEQGLSLFPPELTKTGKPATNSTARETLKFQIERELERRHAQNK